MKLTTEKIRKLIREEISKIAEGSMFGSQQDRFDDEYGYKGQNKEIKFKDAKILHYTRTTNSGEERYFIKVTAGDLDGDVFQVDVGFQETRAASKGRLRTYLDMHKLGGNNQANQKKVFDAFVRGVGRGR